MPQKRNRENRGLPSRWRHVHGAYYYAVPLGLEPAWDGKRLFRLGANLSDAYRVWSERIGHATDVRTVADLLDRYLLEVVPMKAAATRQGNRVAIKMLRRVFGSMSLASIKPRHVYQYADKRAAKVGAHREIEVLSHAYTKAVEWGYLDRHPFKGQVRLHGNAPRTRYVEDWEVLEALALPSVRTRGSVRMIKAYIRLKLLTGLRRGDLLRLRVADNIRDDGIHVTPHKTGGHELIYEWTDELHAAVNNAMQARNVHISPWLFCSRDGSGYIDESTGEPRGWKSMWQRFMDRLIAETKIVERFHEHDLRAKVASDAESLERARQLLAHADTRTTLRVYRRKPEKVTPTR